LTKITFHTIYSGKLIVTKEKDSEFMYMDLPIGKPEKVNLDEEVVKEICSLIKLDYNSIKEIQCCGITKKLLIQVEHPDHIDKLSPDFQNLEKINFKYSEKVIKGLIITSLPRDSKKYEKYDFVSRYFAPWNGINEGIFILIMFKILLLGLLIPFLDLIGKIS
jgi:predicted PhzF superfamily epimerase YddE/YHI9